MGGGLGSGLGLGLAPLPGLVENPGHPGRPYIFPISPPYLAYISAQEAANEMELAQRARMDEMRERQRRRQEQSELDAVMGL